MAEIIMLTSLVLLGEPPIPTPSRSSNPQNSLTPLHAQQWQAQQDRLAREAYARAQPASSVAEMFRFRR